MDVELLLNPWVISAIIVIFIVGNLASMKYLGKSHLVRRNPNQKSDLDKLIEIYKEKDKADAQQVRTANKTADSEPTKEQKNDQ
ncbi:MAG: DUF2897 domain-containing protein [Vibrio sp.]